MSAPKLTDEQEKLGYEYKFECEMCGKEIDEDHCYCTTCEDHAGDWVLVDKEGELV